MTGKELKERVMTLNYSATYIAEKMGVSPQALNSTFNASDVKSGTLEKLCDALGVTMSFFYPEVSSTVVNNNNNIKSQSAHNIANGSGNITESSNDELVKRLLDQNEMLIKMLSERK